VSPFRRIPPGEEFPVSATLFVTYLKCPQQALARLQGVYPPATRAMFRGSLAHRVFARHLVDGVITPDDFTAACRQEAGAHLGGSMAELSLKPSEFRRITAEVEQLYDRFKSLPTDGFEDAEVDVQSEPVEGIALRGRVDAVFVEGDEVRIVDWKTGSSLDDAEPQLAFYAMAWQLANGSLPTTMEALSLKTGERRMTQPTEESAALTEMQVADMITALRGAMADRSEMPRTAGPHCRWCPLLDGCAEGAAALKILES
jgi:RecB family exonuclease